MKSYYASEFPLCFVEDPGREVDRVASYTRLVSSKRNSTGDGSVWRVSQGMWLSRQLTAPAAPMSAQCIQYVLVEDGKDSENDDPLRVALPLHPFGGGGDAR